MGYGDQNKYIETIESSFHFMFVYWLLSLVIIFIIWLSLITMPFFGMIFGFGTLVIYPIISCIIMNIFFILLFFKIYKEEIFFQASWQREKEYSKLVKKLKISLLIFVITIVFQILSFPTFALRSSFQLYLQDSILFLYISSFSYFFISTFLFFENFANKIKKRIKRSYGMFGILVTVDISILLLSQYYDGSQLYFLVILFTIVSLIIIYYLFWKIFNSYNRSPNDF